MKALDISVPQYRAHSTTEYTQTGEQIKCKIYVISVSYENGKL